jgi:hypothetical protein
MLQGWPSSWKSAAEVAGLVLTDVVDLRQGPLVRWSSEWWTSGANTKALQSTALRSAIAVGLLM